MRKTSNPVVLNDQYPALTTTLNFLLTSKNLTLSFEVFDDHMSGFQSLNFLNKGLSNPKLNLSQQRMSMDVPGEPR